MAATSEKAPVEAATVVKEVAAPSQSYGFKDWKQNRVFSARSSLDQFKAQKVTAPASVDPNQSKGAPVAAQPQAVSEAPTLDKESAEKLRQLEFNLEIALGLTIHDYFALYLKHKNKGEMVEVIQKLSPEELSELMMAYSKQLYGAPTAGKENPKTLTKKL